MELYKCCSWKMDEKAEDVQVGEQEARVPLLAAMQLMYTEVHICQSSDCKVFNIECPVIGMGFHCP